jgi:predicted  nucleic acid-binding Zn-ribbon protein
MNFAIQQEMDEFFRNFDGSNHVIEEEVRKIETELLTPIRAQIRVLESELNELYGQAGDLENQIRDARRAVEVKQREAEDQVFDLLEEAVNAASGTNPVVDEPVVEPTTVPVEPTPETPVDSTPEPTVEPTAVGAGA